MKKHLMLLLLVLALSVPVIVFPGSQTTSSTLASAIITQARSYLNEPTEKFWTDAEMLIWVNDGSMDIVARTHCLEDTEAETLVAAQTDYPLTDPFIIIKYVIYDNDDIDYALIKGSPEEVGRTPSSEGGIPTHWAQWENNLIVYPPPDSDAAGGTITAYVVDRPAAVLKTATVLIPEQYDKALVYYVVGQAWAKDGKMGKAGSFANLYLQELDRFRADFTVQVESDK